MLNKIASVVIFVTALLGLSASAAEQQDVVSIGNTSLKFPAITAFAIIPPSSPAFAEGERLTIPSNRLLAVYRPNGKDKDANNRYRRQIAVQSYRKTENTTVSIKDFQAVRSQFRVNNQALIDAAADNARKFEPNGSDNRTSATKYMKVGALQPLEMFNKKSEWAVSMLMRMNYEDQVDGKSVQAPTIGSITLFLLRGKVCFLYVYSADEAPDAVDFVKSETLAWLDAAYKENNTGQTTFFGAK